MDWLYLTSYAGLCKIVLRRAQSQACDWLCLIGETGLCGSMVDGQPENPWDLVQGKQMEQHKSAHARFSVDVQSP